MDGLTTFQIALRVYGILCLCFMPITLIVLVILDKKTNVLKKWNALIDFCLLPKAERKKIKEEKAKAAAAPEQDKQKEAKEKEKKPAEESEKENFEKQGIAYMVLRTGDTYMCYPNRNTRLQGSNEWTCAENFTGEIDQNGKFTAKIAGKANILYNESLIYTILVEPNNKKWFAHKTCEDILEQHSIDDIKSRLVNRNITAIDDENGTVTYGAGPNRTIEETYQQSENGSVVRAVFKIENRDDEMKSTYNSLVTELNDRFMAIKDTPSKTYRIWYHENYDDAVDAIAFLKVCNDTDTPAYILGIERSWRINGRLNEIRNNLVMVEKSFKDCLGKITLHEPWIDEFHPKEEEVKSKEETATPPPVPTPNPVTEQKETEAHNNDEPNTIETIESFDYNPDDGEPNDFVEEGEVEYNPE